MGRQINVYWVAGPRGGKWMDSVITKSESDMNIVTGQFALADSEKSC